MTTPVPRAASPVLVPVPDLIAPVPLPADEPPAPPVEEPPAPDAERAHVARVTRRQYMALYILHIEMLSEAEARSVLNINKKKFDSAFTLAATKLEAVGINPKSQSQIRIFLDNPEAVYASKPVLAP